MNKIKFKKKREFTKVLGVAAVYMDHRKNCLHCKFPLGEINLQGGLDRAYHIARTAGYKCGTDHYNNHFFVDIPYDSEEQKRIEGHASKRR